MTKFKRLRQKFSSFIFLDWHANQTNNKLHLTFNYKLTGEEDHYFKHQLIYLLKDGQLQLLSQDFDNLIFNLGVMESINYWKLACPNVIELNCGSLTVAQEKFWKKLFFKGLGEFRYVNQLTDEKSDNQNLNIDNFVQFKSLNKTPQIISYRGSGNLIPIGGGKDSNVSLEILKSFKQTNLPLVVSAPVAAYDSIQVAGYDNYLDVQRILDPKLLDLNQAGFLNGHVPFSACLAFIAVVGAVLTDKKHIALSNENSANEPSILGTDINHQYSKSLEFETDFRTYLAGLIEEIDYFSLLRPLSELQITELFSHHSQYHEVFRSCNVGKKTNSWCGHCPKCLFVFIMLSVFLDQSEVVKIFGQDLLINQKLVPILDELLGVTSNKPFECVGTVDEVRFAMSKIATKYLKETQSLPALIEHYQTLLNQKIFSADDKIRKQTTQNFVPDKFKQVLQAEMNKYEILF